MFRIKIIIIIIIIHLLLTDDDDDDDDDDVDDDHDGPDEDGLEDEDELEDEFDEYGHSLHHHPGYNTRIITTVPAKEPSMSAVPLKSAMKKPKNGTVAHSKSKSPKNVQIG